MHQSRMFYIANMSFYAFRENKILAKISEFSNREWPGETVYVHRLVLAFADRIYICDLMSWCFFDAQLRNGPQRIENLLKRF